MGNFTEALAAEVERLRKVLARIIELHGVDAERIAREALLR